MDKTHDAIIFTCYKSIDFFMSAGCVYLIFDLTPMLICSCRRPRNEARVYTMYIMFCNTVLCTYHSYAPCTLVIGGVWEL